MSNKTVSYLSDTYLDEAKKDLPQQDAFVQDAENLLKARIRAAAANPGATDQGGYTQVDLKPEWYKTFLKQHDYEQNGPPLTSTAGAVATSALQAGAQGAQANADRFAALPGAKAGDIMNMQRRAGAAGLLSGALGTLLNKNSSDFDKQQSRAVKDAESLKRNSKTGVSTNELLGYLNYEKTGLQGEQRNRKQIEANAEKITKADPNSQESHNTQSAAVSSGVLTPEQAASMSDEQLRLWRTAHMQTQAQRNKTDEFDYEHAVNEGSKIGAETRADVRRIEGEQRDQQLKNLQASVPGYRWANDTPPDPATQVKAREFATAQHDLVTGAQEMKLLQEQLQQIPGIAGLSPATVGQYVDKYLGDEKAKQLLARAQLLQQKMVTAARKDDNLGVLQQFEKAMEDSVNPTAGSIGAYFRGSAPWDAIADYYTKYGTEKLATMGLFRENDPNRPTGSNTVMDRPASEQVTTYEAPVARRPTPGRPQIEQAGEQEFGNPPSLGVAPVPALPLDARQARGPSDTFDGPNPDAPLDGQWVVEFEGKTSKPRTLTNREYKLLEQKVAEKYKGKAVLKQVK